MAESPHGRPFAYDGPMTKQVDAGETAAKQVDIVLTTMNARYIHAAFGLRYLLANLGDLQTRATICEYTLEQSPSDIAEELLRMRPRIVGISVYIWNAREVLALVRVLRAVAPQVTVVVGGPEVSYEHERSALVALVDYVVCGEGEVAFAELCHAILEGKRPLQRIRPRQEPKLDNLALPYAFYTDKDLAHRVLYMEASRGCPYRCAFCLSALDERVRTFPSERLFAALSELLDRGARVFKFVDRTFNLKVKDSLAILSFFRERVQPGMLLHFEMVPDRLPEALRTAIAEFPPHVLQLEIGIQTWNQEVAARIERRQDLAQTEANLRYLRQHTHAHLHVDLIAGLPGEDWTSFANGFNRLVALEPHEIQVGILKRLKGAPIVRHEEAFALRFAEDPPYDVLATSTLSFADMQKLKRFSMLWDRVANRGKLARAVNQAFVHAPDPFRAFDGFAHHVHARESRVHSLQLDTLAHHLAAFLPEVTPAIREDYAESGRLLPAPLRHQRTQAEKLRPKRRHEQTFATPQK